MQRQPYRDEETDKHAAKERINKNEKCHPFIHSFCVVIYLEVNFTWNKGCGSVSKYLDPGPFLYDQIF